MTASGHARHHRRQRGVHLLVPQNRERRRAARWRLVVTKQPPPRTCACRTPRWRWSCFGCAVGYLLINRGLRQCRSCAAHLPGAPTILVGRPGNGDLSPLACARGAGPGGLPRARANRHWLWITVKFVARRTFTAPITGGSWSHCPLCFVSRCHAPVSLARGAFCWRWRQSEGGTCTHVGAVNMNGGRVASVTGASAASVKSGARLRRIWS